MKMFAYWQEMKEGRNETIGFKTDQDFLRCTLPQKQMITTHVKAHISLMLKTQLEAMEAFVTRAVDLRCSLGGRSPSSPAWPTFSTASPPRRKKSESSLPRNSSLG